jgi:predicted acyl esterase
MGPVEHQRALIETGDGTRLATRLWLPDARPAPVILEALPYRMDDLTSSYAAEYERLCSEGGFAVARVDVRGTGSSTGIPTDEYPPEEQRDLAEVIAWLAEQEWSNGRVGMFGTSYSGFNSLQVAAERPPALEAICAIYATDDRYTDDVHFAGGARRGLDLVDYVHYMTAMNLLPPVPAVFGGGWRKEWQRRIEACEPWLLRWLEEQTDGPYWRQGSLRLGPDGAGYDRIACPTMIVAGWADGYRNNTFRTFEHLRCEKRLLIGPWSHMATTSSLPGPHLDLVPELERWFGRWLRDDESTGIDDEPPIRVFVRRSTRPEPDLAEMNGHWRYEPGWPLERARTLELRHAAGIGRIAIEGDLGTSGWISCAGRLPWGQPLDQRADDARSLCLEWPVEADTEIMGHPRLSTLVTSNVAVAFLSAKLCDVFPDGTSTLVTRGLLNLTHRTSSTDPEPLEPGVPTAVEVELEATSWTFEAGHTIRLALAGADWPNIWPPPYSGTLEVDLGATSLTLTEIPEPPAISEQPVFSRSAPGLDTHAPVTDAPQPPVVWEVSHDVLGRETRVEISHGADYNGEAGATVHERYTGSLGVSTVDPGSAWARATASYRIDWPEATIQTEAHLEIRSDAKAFHVEIDVLAEELGASRHERRFERTIARRFS